MIDPIVTGYAGIFFMLLLVCCGVPIAFAMAGVGIVGLTLTMGVSSAATQCMILAWEQGSSFILLSIPLFILMGTLSMHSGIVTDLFDCIRKWVGKTPGGLAVAGVLACAGFGAVTGSTAASVATMGKIVLPELERYKYNMPMCAATIASSGGLAALIPPSVYLIIFSVLTDQSIGALFMAVLLPGLLVTASYAAYILIRCRLSPEMGPSGPECARHERLAALRQSLPVVLIFLLVIGGIYGGIFTPTEASAVGVVGVLVIAACMRRLTVKTCIASLREMAILTTVIFLIMIGGWILSRFLVTSGTTDHFVQMMVGIEMSKTTLIAVLTVVYLLLGCILESTAILILTMPVIFPIIVSYGIDPIWFGVYITMLLVLGQVTPPIGANVFILYSIYQKVSIKDIFVAALPFVICMIIDIILVVLFPAIVLWLPSTMSHGV